MNIHTDILLRPAHSSEARLIAALSRTHIEYGLDWRWTPARVRSQIQHPESIVLVASKKGNLTGFAIMRFGDANAHLMLFAVKPNYQRLGIGRALLHWLEKSAVTAGMQLIRLEVRESNRGAIRFYESLGYKQIEQLDRYYDSSEAAVVMSRQPASRALD